MTTSSPAPALAAGRQLGVGQLIGLFGLGEKVLQLVAGSDEPVEAGDELPATLVDGGDLLLGLGDVSFALGEFLLDRGGHWSMVKRCGSGFVLRRDPGEPVSSGNFVRALRVNVVLDDERARKLRHGRHGLRFGGVLSRELGGEPPMGGGCSAVPAEGGDERFGSVGEFGNGRRVDGRLERQRGDDEESHGVAHLFLR